ncbi:hypothetical protein lerEdw1_000624 [Lerista edwardsae]|nr:hypothetical protein lerEdw1_000624 [Lerista edwardsae]
MYSTRKMSDFHLDLNPLKEPLGFIKLLEWPGNICNSVFFRLNKVTFTSPDPTRCNGTWTDFHLVGNFSSSAQFFVTFAVVVFLYCMAALVLYLGYMHLYRNVSTLPMIDYIFGLCAVFLWLVSTAAWAKALVDIKVSTGPRIVKEIPVCQKSGVSCVFDSVTSMGSLNVSVVCIKTCLY